MDPYIGDFSLDQVVALAETAQGTDADRKEFVTLARAADSILDGPGGRKIAGELSDDR